MENTKRYAHIENPAIAAVIHEMYRLDSAEEAGFKIAWLAQHFVIAKKQIANPKYPSVILWIRGWEVSPDEEKAGFVGHFALVSYKKIGKRYTLFASKMAAPIKNHPQRAQIRRENPNWGHPVLRSVRKQKIYGGIEAAQAELDLLHEHFPSVSIPNPGKLYIMIYCADRPARERMVKHIVAIKHSEAKGGYYLECSENTHKSRAQRPLRKTLPPASAPQGKFTAKVALARSRKAKKPKA